MKIKKILMLLIIFLAILTVFTTFSHGGDKIEEIVSGMSRINEESNYGSGTKIHTVINNIIFLIQVAGTGISLIVITMQGIKYMMASVEDKAEIKKQAMPILIGCILLFGAVNLMAVVSSVADTALSS